MSFQMAHLFDTLKIAIHHSRNRNTRWIRWFIGSFSKLLSSYYAIFTWISGWTCKTDDLTGQNSWPNWSWTYFVHCRTCHPAQDTKQSQEANNPTTSKFNFPHASEFQVLFWAFRFLECSLVMSTRSPESPLSFHGGSTQMLDPPWNDGRSPLSSGWGFGRKRVLRRISSFVVSGI